MPCPVTTACLFHPTLWRSVAFSVVGMLIFGDTLCYCGLASKSGSAGATARAYGVIGVSPVVSVANKEGYLHHVLLYSPFLAFANLRNKQETKVFGILSAPLLYRLGTLPNFVVVCR